MIHEMDAAIRTLLRRDVLADSEVDIAFDAPSRQWAARQNKPTVNVYLYDIREDVERRQMDFEVVRDDDGMPRGRKRPPRRFKLSYLITAWTQRPEDEHRLLAAVLMLFLAHDTFPTDLVPDPLRAVKLPLILQIGAPPPQAGAIADVWSAMGGELKPSLDLSVVIPLDPGVSLPVGPPVLEQPRITVREGADDVRHEQGPIRPPHPRNRPPSAPSPRTNPAEELTPGVDGKGRVLRMRHLP